jgi:hypothetical protein
VLRNPPKLVRVQIFLARLKPSAARHCSVVETFDIAIHRHCPFVFPTARLTKLRSEEKRTSFEAAFSPS